MKVSPCCGRVEGLEAKIEAALALHVEIEGAYHAKVCRECSGMYSVSYPCPTVKALKGDDVVLPPEPVRPWGEEG